MHEETDPIVIRNKGVRMIASGVVCFVGVACVAVAYSMLDASLTQTHQQLNGNNSAVKLIAGAGLLFVVLGPIFTIAGIVQLVTKKDIWHALTKPM